MSSVKKEVPCRGKVEEERRQTEPDDRNEGGG